MQLIMEDWRRFLNEDDGKTPAQLITDFEAAEETLKSVKDEKTRKEILGKLFVGVSFLAFSIYAAPILATALTAAGMKLAVGDIIARVTKSGIVGWWNTIDDDIKEKVVDKLPDLKGEAKGKASEMISKLLNMPDEKSAQSAFLAAVDLPDGLDNMLSEEAYQTALAKIKARLRDMAVSGQEMQGDSLSLASNTLKKAYGVYPSEPQAVQMS